jgi:hypothetical protein
MSAKTSSAADLAKRIELARIEAVKPPLTEQVGPEWPSKTALTLDEAVTELTVQMYTLGAKISFGLTGEATSVWARISFPKWSAAKDVPGMSALTFSSTLEGCMIKLAQLLDEPVNAGFKPDPYAK